MVYQPILPYPYMSVVDANDTNGVTFKCLLNPRDSVIGYVFQLKKADTGEVVYTTSKIFDTPIYGSTNNNTWIEINVPHNSGLVNGDDYVWNILLCSSNILWYVIEGEDYNTSNFYSTGGANYYCLEVSSQINNSMQIKKISNIDNINSQSLFVLYKTGEKYFLTEVQKHELNSTKSNGNITGVTAKIYIDHNKIIPIPTENQYFTNIMGNNQGVIIYDGIKSYDYYFKARDNAELLLNIPDVINSNIINFTATYSQKQYIPISYYTVNLYLGNELIDTTGIVISSNVEYTYNGLENEKNYSLEIIVVNAEKSQIILNKDFSVAYEKHVSMIKPLVNMNLKDASVEIDFSKNSFIDGYADKNDTCIYKKYKNSSTTLIPSNPNAIQIPKNQSIYWNKVNNTTPISFENTTQVIHWHGHEGFYGTIAELSDETNPIRKISVGYDGKNFYFKNGNSADVTYCPYAKTASAIGSESSIIDSNTVYLLDDTDTLTDTDVLLSNDLICKYWWIIVIYPNEAKFYQSAKYEDTVVNE